MGDLPVFLTLRSDSAIVLTGHRIGLEQIVACFADGYTPEMIAEEYPTLPLALIYKVIAFYLDHRDDVLDYCERACQKLDAALADAKCVDLAALRERLIRRQMQESSTVGSGS